MSLPKVSIILAVKNETDKLILAVDDLLNQTYTNLEIIISDDASSNPNTKKIIESFFDPRIVKIYHNSHQGLSKIKNYAIQKSTGEFIAIADADDRYHRQRIELQVKFLQKNTAVFFCGTNIKVLGENFGWNNYTKHNFIAAQCLLNNPFVHPSIMFRKQLLQKNYAYNSNYDYAEDYLLFSSFRNQIQCANLPQALVFYNTLPKTGELKKISENQQQLQSEIREIIVREDLNNTQNFDMNFHHAICNLAVNLEYKKIPNWYNYIVSNYKNRANLKALKTVLVNQVYRTNKYKQLPTKFRIKTFIYCNLGLKYSLKYLLGL